MKTSLAYIDDQFQKLPDQLPASEMENVKATASVRHVAGFSVQDEVGLQNEVERRMASRRSAYYDYLASKEKLVKHFKAKDVTPLAFLPTKAWNSICENAGLLQIAPTTGPNGPSIMFDTRTFARRLQAETNEKFEAAAIIFAVCAVLAGVGIWMVTQHPPQADDLPIWLAIPMMVVIGAAAGCFVSGIALWLFKLTVRSWVLDKVIIRKLIAKATKPENLRQLISNFTPGRTPVTIQLPEPPEDVRQILLKAYSPYAGRELRVALVPEAFRFTEPLHDVVKKEFKKIEEEDAWALAHDPIVYLELDNAVAIIAQFGDFPIEQEVVDQVKQIEYLI
jgi:hypothetical protein